MVYEYTSLLTSLLRLELDKYKNNNWYATASVCVSFYTTFSNIIFKKMNYYYFIRYSILKTYN